MDGPEDIALSEGWGAGSTRHRRWKFRGGFSSASSHNNNSQHSKPQYAWTSNPHQRGVGVSLLISKFVLSVAVTRLVIHGYGTRPMQPNLRKNDGVVPEENILNESQQMNELQKGEEKGGSNSIKITTSASPPPTKEMRENVGNSVKTLKSTDVKKIQLNGEDKGKSNSIKITTNSINLFPRGCHWECYIDNHPDLIKALPRTEEAANAHYLESSANETRDCRC